jgi:hypothetical protein
MSHIDPETLAALETARMAECHKLQTDESPLFRARAAHSLRHYVGNLKQIISSNDALLAHSAVERAPEVRGAMRSSMIILCGHGVDMDPNIEETALINAQLAEALAFRI